MLLLKEKRIEQCLWMSKKSFNVLLLQVFKGMDCCLSLLGECGRCLLMLLVLIIVSEKFIDEVIIEYR